jgi:hypothetical protein
MYTQALPMRACESIVADAIRKCKCWQLLRSSQPVKNQHMQHQFKRAAATYQHHLVQLPAAQIPFAKNSGGERRHFPQGPDIPNVLLLCPTAPYNAPATLACGGAQAVLGMPVVCLEHTIRTPPGPPATYKAIPIVHACLRSEATLCHAPSQACCTPHGGQ